MAGEENRRLVDLDGLLLVGVRRRVEVAEEDFGGPESD
jgi:hypothetical protein